MSLPRARTDSQATTTTEFVSDDHTSAGWVSAIAAALDTHTGDSRSAMASAGLDPDRLADPAARYPMTAVGRLWKLAHAEYGEGIGLEVANSLRPDGWSTLGRALRSSVTMAEFLHRCCRYGVLVTDAITVDLRRSPTADARISTRFLRPAAVDHDRIEAYMGAGLLLARQIFGGDAAPFRVDLTRPRPTEPRRWHQVFGPEIKWQASEVAVHVDAATMAAAAAGSSRIRSKVFGAAMDRELDYHPITVRARREIFRALPDSEPSLTQVAAQLFMTERTLQRRLAEEGLGFRELAELSRRQLAERYLATTGLTLSDIALLTGFSNQSNFTHAFRRWTGLPPGIWRDANTDQTV
ncbi:AraC family transcriptional regulator ligand-binding domain-containing protein [Nocardia sp. NPDC056952]|uniref:AraC family transcriptional regulator n=1 Tax=Nocardia sp. NPDC056952 TaxID=3345979 RepID=UPI0036280354